MNDSQPPGVARHARFGQQAFGGLPIVAMLVAACSFRPGALPDARAKDGGGTDADPDSGITPADVLNDGTTDSFTRTCPPGYAAVGGSYYRYEPADTGNWSQARTDCEDDDEDGGAYNGFTHLVVLANDAERAVLATFRTSIDDQKVWLGAADSVTEGTWLWVTLETITSYPPASGAPWKSSEPNADGDCLQMANGAGEIEDRPCNGDTERYVCECDGHDESATQY